MTNRIVPAPSPDEQIVLQARSSFDDRINKPISECVANPIANLNRVVRRLSAGPAVCIASELVISTYCIRVAETHVHTI